MSSLIFDIGDYQRLEREARLTEQLPRQPVEPDRSPDEILDTPEMEPYAPKPDYDVILEGFLQALNRRLLQ